MAPVAATMENQAEVLRHQGNVLFKKERLGPAIDAYTEAITLCPNVAVYWTNRALCFRRRNEWKRVEEDSRKAIELDINSVKGHYMLGIALLERKEFADGIKELEKALELGRGANQIGYMVEEIWQVLANAKYLEWELESTERTWKMQNLREACKMALSGHQLSVFSPAEGKLVEDDQLEYLNTVFNQAAQPDIVAEIPDYLCCKITLDIFRDPVITPSGVTYERAVILDHLQRVGKFDPTTREPLEQHQLVPNLAIKEAVKAFLDAHGWAYKMS